MRDARYLRAQAELCLRIARQMSDETTADNLRAERPGITLKRLKMNLSTSRRQHEPLPSRLDPLERRDVRFGSLADIAA